MNKRRYRLTRFAGAAVLIFAFFVSLLAGNTDFTFAGMLSALMGNGTEKERLILYAIRFPRTLASLFCGSALALSGLMLQTALNNSLASPSVIGINSGASMFVLLAGILFPGMVSAKMLFSFLGSFTAVFIVLFISVRAGFSKTSMVLAGVAVSALFSAFINLIITIEPDLAADKAAFTLGGFSNISTKDVWILIPGVVLLFFFCLFLSRGLDLLPLGDDMASSLGLNVKMYRGLAILAAAVLAGLSVSVCGMLSFAGLIIPNLIRIAGAEKLRDNIFLSVIYGGGFVMLCDTAARTIVYPYELPAGLIISMLGAPFFIYILIKKKRRLSL